MSNAVPDGWSYNNLSDLAFIDKESLKGSTDPDYEFKYVDIASVSTGRIDLPTEYIRFKDSPSRARKRVQQGDVIMSTVRPNLQAFAYFDAGGADYIASTGFAVIRAKDGNSGEFLFNTILADDITGQIDALVVGSNYPAINSSDVKNLGVLTPTQPEQQKIATILSSVDDVIEKTQAQIDKLKDLKTGMMQELLTKGIGHTEFKDSPVGRIPVGWDVKHLNQLVTIKHGYAFEGEYFRTTPTQHILLTPGNFNRDGRLYFGHKTKYYEGPIPDGFILENGDVLVVMTDLTKEMTILGNTIVMQSSSKVLHNQRIGKVETINDGVVTKDYLCFVMNSDSVKTHIKDTATGTTVRHTSPTKILEPLVPIPPIEEQQKIMEGFQSLEDRLSVAERKLSTNKNVKKALMQDLLTGTVRVTVPSHPCDHGISASVHVKED